MNRIVKSAVFFFAFLLVAAAAASAYESYVWFVDLDERLYKKEPNSRTQETGYQVSGQVVVEAGEDASSRLLENYTRQALQDWADETAEEKTDNAYSDCTILRYFDDIAVENMDFDGDCWWVDISGVLVETICD